MSKITVQISKETFEFLKSLGKEVETQDNRSTAKPYFIALQVAEEYPSPDGYDYDKTYYLDKHGNPPVDSIAEVLENDPEHSLDEIKETNCRYVWEVHNVFLTDRGYNEHLRLNRHNIRKESRSFMYHAFRNPEFDGIFKAIAEFKDLEPVSDDLPLDTKEA